jgi:hypothetical protein
VIIVGLMCSENVERSNVNHCRVDVEPNENFYCECVNDYGL